MVVEGFEIVGVLASGEVESLGEICYEDGKDSHKKHKGSQKVRLGLLAV